MADLTDSTHVAADASTLFDYLSDIANLPDYFSRMTAASPGDGDEVHTTAVMPNGDKQEGHAWFRVDEEQRQIEWGSEGPSDYHGRLAVRADGSESEVEVSVHTDRVSDDDGEMPDGIRETLDNIKRIVEGSAEKGPSHVQSLDAVDGQVRPSRGVISPG